MTKESTVQFLDRLERLDILVSLDGDRLTVNAPKGVVTPELRAEIVRHKASIIELLASASPPSLDILPIARNADSVLSAFQSDFAVLNEKDTAGVLEARVGLFSIEGNLDRSALERAFQEVIGRHEILRTGYGRQAAGLVPVTGNSDGWCVSEIAFRGVSAPERMAEARERMHSLAKQPFDLACPPLIRALEGEIEPGRHVVLLSVHRMAADERSLSILCEELRAIYASLTQAAVPPVSALPVQFVDFAAWQRAAKPAGASEKPLAWWLRTLQEPLPVLELPLESSRRAVGNGERHRLRMAIPADLAAKVADRVRTSAVGNGRGTTPYLLFLAALKVLLHRYTLQDDILVSTTVAGRVRPELERLIGPFDNTVLLRTSFEGDPTASEAIGRARDTVLGAQGHASVTFERLAAELPALSGNGGAPIARVLFEFGPSSYPGAELPGLKFSSLELSRGAADPDLTLHISEAAGAYVAEFEFDPGILDSAVIRRMQGHYLRVLEGLIEDDSRPISRIPLLSPGERAELLHAAMPNRAVYPSRACIHELISAQAGRTPDRAAVSCGGVSLTYSELESQSSRLAGHLRRAGIRPGAVAAICLDRSVLMPVALLGVLKAGGAYVPLDPEYPVERLSYMLQDSRAAVVITESRLAGRISPAEQNAVYLDQFVAGEGDTPGEPWNGAGEFPPTAEDTAYIIYTSGSTGKPKGVRVSHRAVVNFLCSMSLEPGLAADDRLLAVTTLCFDIAGLEMYLPLIRGAEIVIAPRPATTDPRQLAELLDRSRITVMQATPATWRMLLDGGWPGKPGLKVLCGGEAMPRQIANGLIALGCEVWNLYGPTETTIWSTVARVTAGEGPVTIGRPIANTSIYVLDRHLEPVPVGVPGELWIGGDGVAQGYWERPELTQERFANNPFEEGGRMYRTGDLARLRNDGTVDFLGRADHQVKIRGFRIELGEIEAALGAQPGIRQGIVIADSPANGDVRLIGYICRAGEASPDIARLRESLARTLPDYMVPALFVVLDEFPLTPNGKIDRKALPAPDRGEQSKSAYAAPRTPIEELVAQIWAEVLQVPRVGIHDDFFDLGGQSLLAIRVASSIAKALQVEVAVQALFETPTVAGLADRIANTRASQSAPLRALPAISRSGTLVPSFAQQRLWFLEQWEPGTATYNIPAVCRLHGPLDRTALERSLDELVRRHESLRTTFVNRDGLLALRIAPAMSVTLPVTEIAASPGREEELRRLAKEETQLPFDLDKGPLMRAKLFRLAEDEHVLSLTLHHIISDGWSFGVLFRELQELYSAARQGRAAVLPELPLQYADYAAWQRDWLKGAELDRQMAYWKGRLAGLEPLELPADHPRPKRQTFGGAIHHLTLPPALTASLRNLSRSQHVTIFMIVAAAFQALLRRYSGQEDIALGIPIAGRNRSEVDGLIGFFVNTLVLRGDLSGNPTFQELLVRTRESAIGAYSHPDVPFEKLVEELQSQRDVSRSPLFQVLLSMQAARIPDLVLGDLRLQPFPVDWNAAKYDLSLYLNESADDFQGFLEYNTDLFRPGTVARMADHFQRILEAVAARPDIRISEIPLLSEAERRRVLVGAGRTDEYPRNQCVHELFESQAARNPEAVAVVADGESLTYGELNRRANQLARHLRGLGVGPEVPVGIYLERSLAMVTGLLGILKAGGTYVPLDPAFPRERLAYMAEDAGLHLILTQQSLSSSVPSSDVALLHLDSDWHLVEHHPDTDGEPAAGPTNLAYILYTSGSTGKPKGVEIPHQALTNFLWSMKESPGCCEKDSILAVTTLSFDIAGLELYLPLITGARIELASRAVAADARLLKLRLEECRPTIMQATPATWRMLIDAGWDGAPGLTVLCGGEALPPDLAQQLLKRAAVLWNLYGPTETTIWSAAHQVTPADEEITIGEPIANTAFYILDRDFQPVPVGVAGELFIGGEGLARGYRNRPDLTEERFLADPFSGSPGARMYRTGDLAKLRDDGRFVHLGRLDHQVKLRGYRIELGEIEAALVEHESVRQAVAVVRQDQSGEACLAAYIVGQPGHPFVAEEIRKHLRTTLPDYMVPQHFVLMEAYPLTANGKIDRKALPPPDRGASPTSEYLAPRNKLEAELAAIWQDLLNVDRVGVTDSFFELGGNSLMAIRITSAISSVFRVEVPLQVLFEAATVAELAVVVAQMTGTPYDDSAAAAPPGGARKPESRTPTEVRLALIWERVLGLRPIGPRTSLSSLNPQPRQVERLMAEVRSVFGVFAEGFPMTAFLEDPTVEAMARIIDGNMNSPMRLIVRLRQSDSGHPLFLVHAGGGYVFFYRALASRLATSGPVYGIRAEMRSDNMGHPFEEAASIQELATRYIREMKTVQPHGPYQLGGACAGGVIAFEMAHQLAAQGEQVIGPVLLFDAYIGNNAQAQRSYGPRRVSLRDRITAKLNRTAALGTVEALRFLADQAWNIGRSQMTAAHWAVRIRLRSLASPVARHYYLLRIRLFGRPLPADMTQRQILGDLLPVTLGLLKKYVPQTLEGRIALFTAMEEEVDAKPLWTGLAAGGMTVHRMPGKHLDMMEEPAVGTTAALVSECLTSADSSLRGAQAPGQEREDDSRDVVVRDGTAVAR